MVQTAESNAMFLFYILVYQSTQIFCKQNNTTQLTELREEILNCNPNSNICSTEFLFFFAKHCTATTCMTLFICHKFLYNVCM